MTPLLTYPNETETVDTPQTICIATSHASAPAEALVAAAGALIPDLDKRASYVGRLVVPLAGWISHSLADMMTPSGVCWFWPARVRCILPGNHELRIKELSGRELAGLLQPLAEVGTVYLIGSVRSHSVRNEPPTVAVSGESVTLRYATVEDLAEAGPLRELALTVQVRHPPGTAVPVLLRPWITPVPIPAELTDTHPHII